MAMSMLIFKAGIDFSSSRRALQYLLNILRKRVYSLLSQFPPSAKLIFSQGINSVELTPEILNSLKIQAQGSGTKDSELQDKGLGRRKSGLAGLHIWLGAVTECGVVDTERKNVEKLYRHVHSALCSVHSALCRDNLTMKQAENKVTHLPAV
jgi:hypothetical protein